MSPASTLAELEPTDQHVELGVVSHISDVVARWFYAINLILVAAVVVFDAGVTLLGIVLRNTSGTSMFWASDYSTITIITTAAVGGATAYRAGRHVRFASVVEHLPKSWSPFAYSAKSLAVLGVGVAFTLSGFEVARSSWHTHLTYLPAPAALDFIPILWGGILLSLFAAVELLQQRPLVLVTSLIVGSAATGIVALAPGAFGGGNLPLWIGLGFAVIAFVFGVPIGFCMVAAFLIFVSLGNAVPIASMAITLQDGAASFVLLAVPFFILTGLLMSTGDVAARIGDLIRVLVGRVPGGFLHVIIATMYVFSGVSGSKAADMAAVGTPLSEVVADEGYEREEIAAILSASAIMGETIPPSIAILVLGSVTSVSILGLFAAGVLPAAVLALMLMAWVAFRERRRPRKDAPKLSLGDVLVAVRRGLIPLAIPLVLMGGLVLGIGTPTEISAVAILLAAVVIIFTGRTGRSQRHMVGEAIAATVNLSGMILFIVAAASVLSWMMTFDNIPQTLANSLIHTGATRLEFFLLVTAALLVFGLILEGLPALVVFAPLLVPAAELEGINLLQFSIVLIIALGVGAFVPPIGVGAYVASAVAGADIGRVLRPMLPYLVVLVVGLFLIVLVPFISLALPRLLNLHGV